MPSLIKLINPIKQYRFWRSIISDIQYLQKTYAPLNLIGRYVACRFVNGRITKQHYSERIEFKNIASSLKLSNDWFTKNIPYWLSVFEEYKLVRKKNTNVLEIGSWEGLSSYFILHTLPNATLTCVDTWEGADEHKAGDAATNQVLNNIEIAFDENLSKYRHRINKYKGTSFSYFNMSATRNIFDVIYVDGSHYCDDVVIDALKCFEMLKVGGIIIFDDYLWKYYPRAIDNPAAAVNVFLMLKKGSYKVVHIYNQIIIEKLSDRI